MRTTELGNTFSQATTESNRGSSGHREQEGPREPTVTVTTPARTAGRKSRIEISDKKKFDFVIEHSLHIESPVQK